MIMAETIVGTICARGGSQRLPRKNLCLLDGKPLLVHAIECALASTHIRRLIVSTDDQEIAEVARKHGAEVPFRRPAVLASDTASNWLVWRHLLDFLETESSLPDMLVEVPTTCPLRTTKDVDRTVEKALLNWSGVDGFVTACVADRNPYFNMVEIDERNALASLVVQPKRPFTRSQDAPVVYQLNTGVYAVRTEYIRRATWLFEGRIMIHVMPRERSVDIDSAQDLRYVEWLLSQRKETCCGH